MMCDVCTRFMKFGLTPIPEECHPEMEIRLDSSSLTRAYWSNQQKEEQ